MRLSSLIASNDGLHLHGEDIDVQGLTADSRTVKPGFLFIAIPGTQQDGRAYIPEAIQNGAVAILAPEGTARIAGTAWITSQDIRASVSVIASLFYQRQPTIIAAVTGTSGKTSTVQFIREMWQQRGHKSASIGTLGLVTADETRYGSLTTPDALTLHQLLDTCAAKDITHLALEASSHGLALHRLDHVQVKIGGFTNLSRDHLDYHQTMAHYLAAKARLFQDVIVPGGAAVLNADIPEFEYLKKIAALRGLKLICYGKTAKDLKLVDIKADTHGQRLHLEVLGKAHTVVLPVIGGFQAWNALCALGIVIASGDPEARAVEALTHISGVPGRLQRVGVSHNGATVYIDYAHKPDALENVLKALRPHLGPAGKLGVVFGCGGNRDTGKRPIMGGIAERMADWVIVTDDNPRHEEPMAIRREILAGMGSTATVSEIGDRAEAIAAGIGKLLKGDVLVIAGKGHERGQIQGDTVTPFDDAQIARKVLEA